MSELFDETDDDKVLTVDDDLIEAEQALGDVRQKNTSDARRRLEDLMEEKRLREELEDYLD